MSPDPGRWIGLLAALTAALLACPVALADDPPAPPTTTAPAPDAQPPTPKPDPAPEPAPKSKAKPAASKPSKAPARPRSAPAPAPAVATPAPAYEPERAVAPTRPVKPARSAPRRTARPKRVAVAKHPKKPKVHVNAARAIVTRAKPVAAVPRAAPAIPAGVAEIAPSSDGRSALTVALLAALAGLSIALLARVGPALSAVVRLEPLPPERAATTVGAGAVIALGVSVGLLVAYLVA